MIAIREEIRDVEEGRVKPEDNPLKNAPHTARAGDRRRVGRGLLARAGGLPGALGPGRQVLAGGGAHRQRLRRPQPRLHLPRRSRTSRADVAVPRATRRRDGRCGACRKSAPGSPRPPARPAPPARPPAPRRCDAPAGPAGVPGARRSCSGRPSHARGHAAAASAASCAAGRPTTSADCRVAGSRSSGIAWLAPFVGAYLGWRLTSARACGLPALASRRRLAGRRAAAGPRDRLRARARRPAVLDRHLVLWAMVAVSSASCRSSRGPRSAGRCSSTPPPRAFPSRSSWRSRSGDAGARTTTPRRPAFPPCSPTAALALDRPPAPDHNLDSLYTRRRG